MHLEKSFVNLYNNLKLIISGFIQNSSWDAFHTKILEDIIVRNAFHHITL